MTGSELQLRMIERHDASSAVSLSVESPARGVVIIDLGLTPEMTPVPLHWRAGDWTKPPLDLTLGLKGDLESIQFVLQDEGVGAGPEGPKLDAQSGLPRFGVEGWPADRYIDVRTEVTASRTPAGSLLICFGSDRPEATVRPGPGLTLGFSAASELVSIEVGPLTPDQWQTVAAAAS